jgi:diaminohydroxyphosphoribosylaminopyrimidine deaminase/5-amino-6-(5-phosphoribosylamino)uracil reductase
MAHQSDIYWLGIAAEQSLIPYSVKRNPRVGAVVVDKSGLAIAKGFHEGYGTAHAEQLVLDKVKGRAKGATLYVNLAPCNHVGKTPSCSVEIINRGIRRVVYSNTDPNPISEGNIEFLKANGVEVSQIKIPKKYENINYRWFKSFELNRPFVTAKIALTLDGKINDENSKKFRITGKDAEIEVHTIRNGCDAIVTGTGTVLADNPRMNVRFPRKIKQSNQPIRYIVGDREIPDDFSVKDGLSQTHFCRNIAPRIVLEELSKIDVRTVLLESGPKLFTQFLNQDLIDELVIYMAPTTIGRGEAIVDGTLQSVSNRTFNISSVGLVGNDLRFKVSFR